MNINDAISQLKSLKEVEPNENWVVSVREDILTKAPYNDVASNVYTEKPSKMDNLMFVYEAISKKYRFIPSMASISMILLVGSFFAVTAAKSSLPGDPLYSVKIANENIVLAVSGNEGDKAKIEIEQAGKRLEELTEISKNSSDIAQQEKVEQLVANFEQKVNSAQTRMAKINVSGEKRGVASVAKVINIQSEKYSDVLVKTSSNLPAVIQDKVSDKLASAISKTEKLNTQSLLIIIETKDGVESAMSDGEIVEKLKKKMDKIGEEASKQNIENGLIEGNTAPTNDGGGAEVNQDSTSAASTDSTVEVQDNTMTLETTTSETETETDAGVVQSFDDKKKTLIESANTSIENNDLQGAAKTIGQILAIDENKVDEKTSSDISVTSGEADAISSITSNGDVVETEEPIDNPTDIMKIDLAPSVNVVE